MAKSAPASTASPTAQSMLATVPSEGATTGISIFIASRTTTVSPAFTACPTLASTLNTLPAAPASILTEPAPALAAGAAAGAALGAATGAALGAAATGAPVAAPSSTVTSYTLPLTVMV